eukprot:m.191363 g.191363  ORF g.191363 m.191363 type:complete len:1438 (+) comp17566_c0_seq4:165-4478(+)
MHSSSSSSSTSSSTRTVQQQQSYSHTSYTQSSSRSPDRAVFHHSYSSSSTSANSSSGSGFGGGSGGSGVGAIGGAGGSSLGIGGPRSQEALPFFASSTTTSSRSTGSKGPTRCLTTMRRSKILYWLLGLMVVVAMGMVLMHAQTGPSQSSALANPLAKTLFASGNPAAAAERSAQIIAAAAAVPAIVPAKTPDTVTAPAAAAVAVVPAVTASTPMPLIPIKPRFPRKPLPEEILAKVKQEAVILEESRAKIQAILQRVRNPQPLPSSWKKMNRRAAIMYIDKGQSSIFREQLDWWIYTWHAIGLSSPASAFDIVVLVDPEAAHVLHPECEQLPPNPEVNLVLEDDAPGKCFYEFLVGIHDRTNKAYDNYMNSMECVYNPVAKFLLRYKTLLRTDIDTFPTPRLNDLYPNSTLCTIRPHGYTFGQARSELHRAAEAIGFQHQGWHEMASSWFGPAEQVVALAELTVESGVFLKNFLFGSGSNCKVPADLKDNDYPCEWGSGVYEGVLLLYSQEFALNMIWTPDDHRTSMKMGWQFDLGTTFAGSSACSCYHLHIHHGEDMFSKFMFHMHRYDNEDLSKTDIRQIPGYSFFMAMNGNKRGTNTMLPAKLVEGPLRDMCKSTYRTDKASFMISRAADNLCLASTATDDGRLHWADCNPFDNRQLFYHEESQIRQGLWLCLRQTDHSSPANEVKEVGSVACTMWLDRGAGNQNWNFSPMGHLITGHSNLCMTVPSHGQAAHTPFYPLLESCRFNDTAQLFQFRDAETLRNERLGAAAPADPDKETLIKLVDKASLCLGWRENSMQAVTTLPCADVEGTQAWILRENGMLTSVLRSGVRTGLCLGLSGTRVVSPCISANAAALWDRGTATGSSTTLIQRSTKSCLTSGGASVTLTVSACNTASASKQTWTISPAAFSSVGSRTAVGAKIPESELVQIIQDEGRCLDRFGPSAIFSYGCQTGSINQLWARIGSTHLAAVEKSGTEYTVLNSCLTLGDPIGTSPCDLNAVTQKWQLNKGLFFSMRTPSVCLVRNDKNLVASGECVMNIMTLFGMRHLVSGPGSYIEKPGWMAYGNDVRQIQQTTDHLHKALEQRRRSAHAVAPASAAATSGRRAIVLYIDDDAKPPYIAWWLFAWDQAGLKDAGIDLIFFAAPTNAPLVPSDCMHVKEPLDVSPYAPGRCMRKILPKLAFRKRHYFPFLDRFECLVSSQSHFLKLYSHILRAELNSMPTPALRSWVPASLQVSIASDAPTYLTPESQAVITKEAARLNITHRGVWKAGLTWYGPTADVLTLARFTLLLSRSLQFSLFGVASACSAPVALRGAAAAYCGDVASQEFTITMLAVPLALNELFTPDQITAARAAADKWEGSTTTGNTCNSMVLRPSELAAAKTTAFSAAAHLQQMYKDKNPEPASLTSAAEYATYIAVSSLKNPALVTTRPLDNLCK